MSYLTRPRGHFYGKITVSMPTGNNATSDYRSRPYFDPAQTTLDLLGGTPAQFRDWFHQLNPAGYVNGGWNYYGDNSIRFKDVVLTSVEMPDQPIMTTPKEDSSIGTQVAFLGSWYHGVRTGAILVDLDPNDGFTTQMIGEEFSLARERDPIMTATSQVKAYSRWLNLWRNLQLGGDRGSAAVWQIAFPPESLAFQDTSASPFLTYLHQASGDGYGICVRLCTYLFHHRTYREIAAFYREGNHRPLPGSMVVVGTIGLWHPDEPLTLPPARVLLPNLQQPLPIPSEVRTQRRGQTFYSGAALAQVDTDRQVITVDLVNTFPEIAGFDTLDLEGLSENLPEKIDLGALSLQVRQDPTSACTCIGAITFDDAFGQPAYNQAGYLLQGGIVEIPYPPELEQNILEGDLVLLQGIEDDSPVILAENPYHVLIDQRSIYLELEDQSAVDIPIQVLLRGKPASAGIVLSVEQSINASSQPREAASNTDTEFAESGQLSDVVSYSPVVVTDEQGKAILRLQPLRAGSGKLWVMTPSDPDWTSVPDALRHFLRSGLGYLLNFRVLPDERHYDDLADDDLTWDVLYTEVFRYYSLLYPIMNAYINFDDEQITASAAARIAAYINPALKDTTIYMPITRDLSAGKRRLIERWAAQIQTRG